MVTPSGVPTEQIGDIVKSIYDKYSSSFIPGGAVAILKDGQKVFNTYFDYSNYDNKYNVTEETLFEWGSVTKLLTHVSIMQLYEKGQLNLTDYIEKHIGTNFLKRKTYKDKITILNLMNHDAGWDEITGSLARPGEQVVDLVHMLHRYEPRQFARPGEFVAYSNYGVALEGYIVSVVSGMSYIDYVKKNIFEKLEMNHTSIDPSRLDIDKKLLDNRAKGYVATGEDFYNVKNVSISLYPAGSGLSTIDDLVKFVNAITPIKGTKSPLFEKVDTLSE